MTSRDIVVNSATEDQLLSYVTDMLGYKGWLWHHAGDSRRSSAGLPDIVAVRGGRVIFAELKTAKGRFRAEQLRWFDRLLACPGVETYCWRPMDLEDIAEILA
jgi:hypothetical protein